MAKASAAPGESATPGYYLDSELTFARGYAYMASHFTSVRVFGLQTTSQIALLHAHDDRASEGSGRRIAVCLEHRAVAL